MELAEARTRYEQLKQERQQTEQRLMEAWRATPSQQRTSSDVERLREEAQAARGAFWEAFRVLEADRTKASPVG